MAASINDKLKKYKSLFSTTLSTGIGTGTSDTITPATVTGLPTDTAITLTIDRVDASGTATPSKMERIKGVVSSGNIINYVRAVDGTTEQAHTAGAVVEMVWNADDWNNAVDHLLVEHGQDGKHTKVNGNTVTAGTDTVALLTASQTLTNKTLTSPVINTGISGTGIAAGSDVTTGTSNTLICTPKSIGDAGVNTRLKSKVIVATRDLTAASGDVSYTGVGFTPTSIICMGNIDGSANTISIGAADSAKSASSLEKDSNGYFYKNDILGRFSTGVGSAFQNAAVKSFDADGFTITWTKVGSPTGTAGLIFLCFR